jgi:hypothetical protein
MTEFVTGFFLRDRFVEHGKDQGCRAARLIGIGIHRDGMGVGRKQDDRRFSR